MANLSDFEKLLPALSPGENAQILKWVVQELGEGVSGDRLAPGGVRRRSLHCQDAYTGVAAGTGAPAGNERTGTVGRISIAAC